MEEMTIEELHEFIGVLTARIAKLEAVRDAAKFITDGSMIRSAYWEEELELRGALQEVDDE